MKLKELAKRLLPPIIVDTAKGLRNQNVLVGPVVVEPPEWEYISEGWRNQDPSVKGWNVESILEIQKAKWPGFLRSIEGSGPLGVAHEAAAPADNNYASHNTLMSYAYVLALAAWKRDSLSLLDWGGGIGHYYPISRALLPNISIDYHCRDLPLLCRGGRELLPEATFHENDDCFARCYDLVLSSSSSQYVEDWKRNLQQLASVSGSYLFITRLPIVRQAPSFVVVQRPYQYGYETEYLGWFLNRQELLDHVDSLQMELVREFLIDERPFVQGAPEQGEYRGFLFRPCPDGRKI